MYLYVVKKINYVPYKNTDKDLQYVYVLQKSRKYLNVHAYEPETSKNVCLFIVEDRRAIIRGLSSVEEK